MWHTHRDRVEVEIIKGHSWRVVIFYWGCNLCGSPREFASVVRNRPPRPPKSPCAYRSLGFTLTTTKTPCMSCLAQILPFSNHSCYLFIRHSLSPSIQQLQRAPNPRLCLIHAEKDNFSYFSRNSRLCRRTPKRQFSSARSPWPAGTDFYLQKITVLPLLESWRLHFFDWEGALLFR